jgi:DNA-binding transcriptional MocR family regulator
LSKSLGAGLRVAYLQAPTPRQTQRLAGALRATTVMASPFTVSLATQWVNDGTAQEMLNAIRSESKARQAIASRVLGEWSYDAHPDGFHLWLPIAGVGGWSSSELALQLRNQGIAAVASAAFSTDGNPPNALRVCLGGSKNREECEEALRIIAETLEHPHHLHSAIM